MISCHTEKEGAASLYVVVFATILFGVIALSFLRIVLSELSQSSNDELSQSAYDSALAGVEDAKIAVNKYYQCVSNPSGAECARYLNMQSGSTANDGAIFNGNCEDFKIKSLLYPSSTDSEVKIQESVSNNSDQAYTCVILKNVVPDYRSTLTSDNRTRVIPLGIGSTSLSRVRQIELRWYSEINGTVFSNLNSDMTFSDKNNASTPPTISLSLLRTGPVFNLDNFNNSTSTDYSTMVFLPTTNNVSNTVSRVNIEAAGNSDNRHDPFAVHCEHAEFACTVTLNLDDGSGVPFFAAGGNAMLVVSMPYGDLVTDFAVTLKDGKGDIINFENVQVSVDSTGRANQLYRRVETRLDPADLFFPYPEYEVELSDGSEDSLLKNFWITYNCWTERGTCNNNGNL